MYLPICNPNKFTLDHCETLEWHVSRSVIGHLLTQDTLRWCEMCYELLFIKQKDSNILQIVMLLGILSSAWNIVREKLITPWLKMLARVARCQNISITIALLRRAIMGPWRLESPASWLLTQPFILAQIKEQQRSSASLAFVWIIHRPLVNSPHKGPVTRKMIPFDNVMSGVVSWCWNTLHLNKW